MSASQAGARRLTRSIQEMPVEIAEALRRRGLEDAYAARPAHQRNDYVGWIGRAKSAATRRKRLEKMLDELERGAVYKGMAHRPSAR